MSENVATCMVANQGRSRLVCPMPITGGDG